MNRTLGCAFILLAALATAAVADTPTKGPEPITISRGQTVQLQDYAVPGKTTIFDFFSEFCPPCRAVAPLVKKLHEINPDIAVVEVDVNRPGVEGIDWNSPVVKEFQLDSIPHFKIYSPEGKLVSEGDPARAKVVDLLKASMP
jgi:thiol-disulfide isomerase/thioredoxin